MRDNEFNFDDLLTVKEAAKLAKTSENRVYDWIKGNYLPPGVLVKLSESRGNRLNKPRYAEWLAKGGLAQGKAA